MDARALQLRTWSCANFVETAPVECVLQNTVWPPAALIRLLPPAAVAAGGAIGAISATAAAAAATTATAATALLVIQRLLPGTEARLLGGRWLAVLLQLPVAAGNLCQSSV